MQLEAKVFIQDRLIIRAQDKVTMVEDTILVLEMMAGVPVEVELAQPALLVVAGMVLLGVLV
jgi:hypothetical protein